MELLTFMAANPWLSFFCLLLLSGVTVHISSLLKEVYVNTIWCMRGIPPPQAPVIKFDAADVKALDDALSRVTKAKKENDENKLKDCR